MYIPSSTHNTTSLQQPDEDIKEGSYFIVDWVGNDPIRRGNRKPVIIAGNLTEEELTQISSGKVKLELPRFGTVQRVLLKVIAIENINFK